MRTVKGALILVFVILMFGCWLMSLIASAFHERPNVEPEEVHRYGVVLLMAYCFLALITTIGEKAITFSPAEMAFLFPGPFSRRQLLCYKVVGAIMTLSLSALFFSLVMRRFAHMWIAAFLGALLILLFVHLFSMTVALVTTTLGEGAYTRRRKFMLIAFVLLIILLAATQGRDLLKLDPQELWKQVHGNALFNGLTTPLRWLFDIVTAENVWPDLILALGRGLLVNGALFAIVLVLDAQYLEMSAAASEQLYARLQRIRTAGTAAAAPSRPGKKPRFTLPDLPWWGGAGPTAWRQLLTVARAARNLLVILAIVLFIALRPLIFHDHKPDAAEDLTLPRTMVAMTFFMTMFFFTLLPFDFRGDLDRMDLLKSLPLGAWQIAVGELIAPVLLVATLQIFCLAAIQAVVGSLGWLLPAGVAFALPFDWLVFGVVNLLFLWFPTRMAQAGADFQLMGRQMLFMMVLWLSIALLAGTAAGVGGLVYWLTAQSQLPALVAAWLVLSGFGIGLIPLVASAFRRFDVAADTPP
jgi:ABC-2 type transport system permease protein